MPVCTFYLQILIFRWSFCLYDIEIVAEIKKLFQTSFFLLFDSVKIFLCCLHPYTGQNNKIFVQTFRCAAALWKSWICKYSIRFQILKLKLLCKILKNEKWKILPWYPNKMRQFRQRNHKCGDWHGTNFQMQVNLN